MAIHGIASAAHDDGAAGLAEMSALGTHGRHPQHLSRDVISFAQRRSGVRFDLFPITCVVFKRDGLAAGMAKKARVNVKTIILFLFFVWRPCSG